MTKIVAPILLTLVLAACGGGGGGGGGGGAGAGGGGGYLRSEVPFSTPVNINHYTPVSTPTYVTPTIGIFTQDLNNDKVDEVVVSSVAFNSTATTGSWKNSNLQVYGFNTGTFKNETSTWFAPGANNYLGGTTVKFGDFNGDGKIDMFASVFTDSNITGPMPVFFNNGNNTFTRTNINFGDVGPHDSTVVDLNNDGYADIVVTDINSCKPAVAFGSKSGNFSVYRAANWSIGGAGVSVADYLGNGSKTMIITDAPGGQFDTRLYSWKIENSNLVLTEEAVLPADRFYLSKWDSVRASTNLAPHAVRNITMDFNNDGKPDVIVFSTMPKNGNVHGYSEVQFIKNNGAGSFTDVTDSVLINYNNNKTTTYNPQLIDVNNDGLMDILISATDYTGQASTSVLLQTKEGKFVESYAQVFSDLNKQTMSMTTGGLQNQSITIVAGPDGKRYLMTGVETTDANGASSIAVYLALIGPTGTVTAPATIATLQQVWPWMSPAEANAALAKSIVSWVNGVPVLDLESAMKPIGQLSITLNGRTGQHIPISGALAVPGMDPKLLNNLQVVDSLNRNFSVNLEGMAPQPLGIPIKYNLYTTDVTQNWTSRFTNTDNYNNNGFHLSGDETAAYALSFTNRSINVATDSQWTWRMGMAVLPNGNPWINVSGMFGTIKDTTMFDFNATRFWHNGFFAQVGVIESIVNFIPGLVEEITPMWLGYAVGGWKNSTGFTMYGGIQPTAFDGEVKVKLPRSVDSQGVMHYTHESIQIRNKPVSFVGADQTWKLGRHLLSVGGVINDQKAFQFKTTLSLRF